MKASSKQGKILLSPLTVLEGEPRNWGQSVLCPIPISCRHPRFDCRARSNIALPCCRCCRRKCARMLPKPRGPRQMRCRCLAECESEGTRQAVQCRHRLEKSHKHSACTPESKVVGGGMDPQAPAVSSVNDVPQPSMLQTNRHVPHNATLSGCEEVAHFVDAWSKRAV